MPVLIQGMEWLGDCIYQRAVIRELKEEIYLETPWPQLYQDLPIKCVRRSSRFSFQARNIERQTVWYAAPSSAKRLIVRYRGNQGKSMLQAMCEAVGVHAQTLKFDLPRFEWSQRKPYVLIRPASVRHGWKGDARSPLPEYLALVAEKLRPHFRIISVADFILDRPLTPLPYADESFHSGELGVEALMALVANASAVVGGVGWLVPASIAYRVPMFLVYGGCGLHNAPHRIFDQRMNESLITQAIPDRFCLCGDHDHQCDKRISIIEAQINSWVVRHIAREQAAMAA